MARFSGTSDRYLFMGVEKKNTISILSKQYRWILFGSVRDNT